MFNILHIIPSLNKGGAERLVLDICNQLNNRAIIKVKLITFREFNSYSFLTQTLDWEVIDTKVISSISSKSFIEVSKLQETIDLFQPDIIHSHLFETEMVLAHIKLPTQTKRIVHFHDNMHQLRNFRFKTIFNKSLFTDFFEKQIVLKSYPKNTIAICISKDNLQYASNVLPKNISIKLLHNAIDLDRFQPKENHPKTNEICIIGSLVDKKGQELAIETVAELISRNLQVHLNILGEGPDKSILQNQINQLGLEKNITLHGNVDFTEQFLQSSKVYLHTAKYEPFGLVLIEAMACGLPVVCTDGKGNRDLIHEGENGFLVMERNPKLLADKIEILLANETLRVEMGQNARKFAEGFGIEKYVDELISIYKS